ncbi:MAG: response regulator transcription factor [Acidobacteriota bacterium]
MAKRYRVILADDHVLVRRGLRRILEENQSLEISGEVGDGLELLSLLNKMNPDMVILDVSMPNLRGIEAIPEIHRVQPDVKVLILTMHNEEEYLYQAISAGADGYLLKEDAEMSFSWRSRIAERAGFIFHPALQTSPCRTGCA